MGDLGLNSGNKGKMVYAAAHIHSESRISIMLDGKPSYSRGNFFHLLRQSTLCVSFCVNSNSMSILYDVLCKRSRFETMHKKHQNNKQVFFTR